MAINYPLPLPTNKEPSKVTFRAKSAVAIAESPFTYLQQVQKHQGQKWEAEITYPPMKREDAEQIAAFLTKLNTREGTFLMGDPAAKTPRGSASSAPGTPVVKGSSQSGNTLNIDGCPNNTTGYLKTGDYIQLGSSGSAYLFKVLDNVDTGSTGAASLTIWPELNNRNQPADNDPVTVSDAKGRWRLTANQAEWTADVSKYGITIPVTGVV